MFKKAVGLFAILSACSSVAWSASPISISLDSSLLDEFSKQGIRQSEVSVVALPLEPYAARRPIQIEHQADQLVNPASVAKVFTTGYALEKLGTAYQFKTGFHALKEPVDGVLQGNLFIKGGGDPVFLTRDLWTSLRALRARGLKEIAGAVVVDRSVFAPPPLAERVSQEEFDDAPHRAYHAAPDGLLMNHGAMVIDLQVQDSRVTLRPENAPASWAFVSEIKPVSGGCRSWKNGLDVAFKKLGNNVVVTFSGPYPARCGASRLPIQIPHQDWLFESWFTELWAELGGRFNGEIQEGKTPENTLALYTHYGPPVSEVVRDVNKWSSNVMARHLELATSGDASLFNQKMLKWLDEQSINTRGWFFENGSGLARKTRIAARGTAQFLAYMATRADFPDFLASMPRAGYDGTLSRRLREVDHFAYLKTGSLSGVRSAAGYLRTKTGQWYALCITVESAKAYNAWPGMEKVVEHIYSEH
ncbi:MAG: D-alanyl-D-alanine carboxypeptidase/D-alanyl-D-alanine-endopeptidase [Limnobacter sp.]|nr:D-alanyl-D-alanine carboxypeptidase/D-alanyl-D-alanine-endopeptidase [Limnobacter sp.]